MHCYFDFMNKIKVRSDTVSYQLGRLNNTQAQTSVFLFVFLFFSFTLFYFCLCVNSIRKKRNRMKVKCSFNSLLLLLLLLLLLFTIVIQLSSLFEVMEERKILLFKLRKMNNNRNVPNNYL